MYLRILPIKILIIHSVAFLDDGSKNTQVLTQPSESPSSSPPAEIELNMDCEQDLTLDNTTPEDPLLGALISQEVPLLENSSQVSIQPEVPSSVLENPVQMEMTIKETTIKQVEPLPEAPVVQPPEESIITSPPNVSVSQDAALQLQDSALVISETELQAQAPPTQTSPEPCLAETMEPAPESLQISNPIEVPPSPPEVQSNGLSEEVVAPPAQLEPPSVCYSEPTMDSPIAQPEELLTNGEGAPGVQELDSKEMEREAHVSPITEPEEQPVPVTDPTPEEEDMMKDPPAESEQAPAQAPKQTSEVPMPGNKTM